MNDRLDKVRDKRAKEMGDLADFRFKATPALSTKEWNAFMDKVERDLKDPSKRPTKEAYEKSKEDFNAIMKNAKLKENK